MRCVCCNKNLSDRESTRKTVNTDEYLDMCDGCYGTIADDVAVIEGHGQSNSPDDLDYFDPDEFVGCDGEENE